MATSVVQPVIRPIAVADPKPRQWVCFSYAAYAKNLIGCLLTSGVPVEPGLTDAEFSAIESTFDFEFPPDLRFILQEGLPVGTGFPNWRSSSAQQLEILKNLPLLGLCKEVSRNNFWLRSWGSRPESTEAAVDVARGFLQTAPVLVPIYRHCYIPSTPCLAGNPVFYVDGDQVNVRSFDIAGFFFQSFSNLTHAPAWAATEARVIDFWTELVERTEGKAAREITLARRGWWSGELGKCLEEVCCRLRNGGWGEEDVREMMMMDDADSTCINKDGDDDVDQAAENKNPVRRSRRGVAWHVRALSVRMLRAGWTTEDVVDSLGCYPHDHEPHKEESCFDISFLLQQKDGFV